MIEKTLESPVLSRVFYMDGPHPGQGAGKGESGVVYILGKELCSHF